MKKAVLLGGAIAIAFAFALLAGTDSASARPQFKKVWDTTYLTPDSKILAAVGEKGSCNVCHQGAKSKKNHNAYGMALKELLSKDDINNPDAIKEALDTVAAKPSVADDEESPTFGSLIEEGTLPLTTEEP